MTPDIRGRIHAFRNALVLAADNRSNECYHLGRWKELNSFPHGCCDLASNFLAQYLQDRDSSLQPVIMHMLTNPEFREKHNSTIQSHVIVRLDDWYIDLTLNQFAEYRSRVVIENRTGTLGSLLRHIRNSGGTVKERDIELHTPNEDGGRLYIWLRDTADSLLGRRTE
ncbi:TPA: hypothetical protein ACY4PY_004764 [Enterobacter cloacae]